MQLTITRGVHAAVTIESPQTTLVIDPGAFGYPAEAVARAAAVLVTHDHFDHVDLAQLTASLASNPHLAVYSPTPLELGDHSQRVTLVEEGDRLTIGDIDLQVVGREQARASIDDGFIPNVGYLIAGAILHPGDARHELPGIDTVFAALAAPWQNNPQLEEHLRRVQPRRIIGIHDATLNDIGRDFAEATLRRIAESYGGDAVALHPGESLLIEV